MHRSVISLVMLVLAFGALGQTPVERFNVLNTQIRDQKITRPDAKMAFAAQMAGLLNLYRKDTAKARQQWCFPVKGYDAKAIGGKNGSGYMASGYSYFDGNRHGGHPAHDIFIHDANQDALDDRTQQPVQVLAALDGVVVATATGWQDGSEQRGGNYIWILCPADSVLLYYAHNKDVLVTPGTVVKQGTAIATVGRSGTNAAKKRSPTHLHFTALKLGRDMLPVAMDTYGWLKGAVNLKQ